MRHVRAQASISPLQRWMHFPSVLWLCTDSQHAHSPSDACIKAIPVAGAVCALLGVYGGVLSPLCLFLCWGLYLSLASVLSEFICFPWDHLLLELSFLSLFLPPLHPLFSGLPSDTAHTDANTHMYTSADPFGMEWAISTGMSVCVRMLVCVYVCLPVCLLVCVSTSIAVHIRRLFSYSNTRTPSSHACMHSHRTQHRFLTSPSAGACACSCFGSSSVSAKSDSRVAGTRTRTISRASTHGTALA